MIWSQSIARRSLLGDDSQNPSIAAKSLLGGRRAVAYATRRLKTRRRPFHRGNPLPAFLGTALGGIGSIFGGGAKKQAEREAWADATLQTGVDRLTAGDILGAKDALRYLFDMAGLRNPGKFGGGAIGAATAKARSAIQGRYEHLKSLIDGAERASATAEEKTAAAGRAARSERMQTGLLEAGTSIGGALATSFGRRGSLRPVRRRRRRRY